MPQIGADVTRVTSTALHALGATYQESNGRTYRYVRAGAAIARGDCLVADTAEEIYAHTPSSAVDQVISGFWPEESGRGNITDNYYFWMAIAGDHSVKAAATVVAGAPYTTSAVAGTVDDIAAAAGNALASASGRGGIFLTATTGGFARVEISGS